MVTTEKESGMVDGQFHAMDRARVEELRKLLHSSIDDIFDKLSFDEKGYLINALEISHNRDFQRVGHDYRAGSDLVLPLGTKMTISVGTTVRELQAHIDKLLAADQNPKAAEPQKET